MTVYTTVPQDDSNLEITVTESDDIVSLDINSASFTLIGAVNSINGLVGDVTLELGLTEGEVQTLIDDSIAAIDYPVDSVNGQTGDVTLTTNEISEDVNLYYTDARVDDYLNSGNITSIAFSNGAPGATTLSWNVDDGTLEFPLNAEVNLQIGQENVILARNESGSTLPDGTAVRVTGAQGARLTVDRASNDNDGLSASTIAITTQTIANNNPGYITTEGLVRGLNTSMWADGDTLYLGSNGALTNVKPVTPLHMVHLGWVVRSHPVEGSIFVDVQNGYELEELHDVLITNVQDGEGLVWDGVNGYWKNATISVDLTGYATEAYVDAAVPTLTSELTNDSGFITSYTESDPVFSASVAAGITTQDVIDWNSAFAWGDHASVGYLTDPGNTFTTDGQFRFITEYGIPAWDPYDGEFRIANYTDPDNSLLNTVRLLTANNNTFLQVDVGDTGGGDDGSHSVNLELQGTQTSITVNSDRLQINAPEIFSENLTLNSGGNPYTLLGGLTTELNIQQSSTPGDYGRLEVNAYKNIDLISWDNFSSPQSNMLRVMKGNIEGGVAEEQSQWNAIQWGSTDGVDFYQIGALGARYDNTIGHETKLQVFDPDTSSLLNNWTVHEHYLYGGKPIWHKSYNNTDRDGLSVTETGMLIWNTDAGGLEVYDGSAWTGVGGGGGASALGDLTDVTIASVSDGDILRYNGTAMEWQNTNLGLSLTPTVSIPSTIYSFSTVVVTVTNWASYDDPNVWAQLKDSGGNVIVTNAQMTDNHDGTFVFTSPSTGVDFVLEVKVQDFGDLASDTASVTFDIVQFGGTFRYWRVVYGSTFTGTANTGLYNVRFYSGANQTGTAYPANMTSATTPAPYVVTSSYYYSATYADWKAFDTAPGGWWWLLSAPGGTNGQWLQVDMGSSVSVQSMTIGSYYSVAPDQVTILASDTGSFTGEETTIVTVPVNYQNSIINIG